ncbi:methyltransferase domain-containing protein [Actinomadura sp. LD22]|uniref:Methyltransferase domain-containing protein n=1 Tax=Actinomadura physcomitrii TaxID=2650748 RepID=A0A6I4MB41_9ACTN|nr:methyltransferase domain-containing protein [Actinomadura physcomitrii]
MNKRHLEYLAGPQWAEFLRSRLRPWLMEAGDLNGDVLEIGPGPGLTTDMLRANAASVTAVEVDPQLAAALAERLVGTNVHVIAGDASRVSLPEARFSTALCLSMLHHVPSVRQQDDLLAAAQRSLRSGGTLIGVDSLDTERIRAAHEDDTFLPIDPETLPARLEAASFTGVVIDYGGTYQSVGDQVRFVARRP